MSRGTGRVTSISVATTLRLAIVASLAVVAMMAAAASASAATRFAEPNGNGTAGPGGCLQIDPCNLTDAVEAVAVADGDEVVLLPGPYENQTDQLVVDNAITVHGQAGQPRPVIPMSGTNGIFVLSPGAVLRDLEIDYTPAAPGIGLFMIVGGTAERVIVTATGTGVTACGPYATAVIRDSICWAKTDGEAAVESSSSGDSTHTPTLRNVTAVASGGSSAAGIDVNTSFGSDTTLNARNVIAVGGAPPTGADVSAAASAQASTSATVDLDYSNYDTELEPGATDSVTDPGTLNNQLAPPSFVDAASGDFHQAAGSPTIDAGTGAATLLGAVDIDGDPRTVGAAPDIGADELVPPAPPPEGGGGEGDTAPPDTQITKKPKDKTKKKTATFEFTSTEPNSTFECKLDDGPFQPCTSPHTVKVKKGKHSFQVRAKDAAGNVDGSPASDDWKVKKRKKKK